MTFIMKGLSVLKNIIIIKPIYIFYIFFLLTFETCATVYALPYDTLIRWISCGLIIIDNAYYSIIRHEGILRILPSNYFMLVVPLFLQSFVNISQTGVALSRSFSFILYVFAIFSIVSRADFLANDIKKTYFLFAWSMVFFVLLLNIIQWGRTSRAGDFLGIYANRNLTVSVMCSILLLVILLLFCLKRPPKIALIVLGVISIVMIFRTHSRMSIIELFIIIIGILYLVQKRMNIIRFIITVVGIIFIIGLLFVILKRLNIVAIDRILTASNREFSTGLNRGDVWQVGIDLFKQKPILGWGNNSVYYNINVLGTQTYSGYGWGVHNSYLVMLVETGVVGCIFYLAFFFLYFKRIVKNYLICKKNNLGYKETMFVRVGLLICVCLLVNGISESFLFAAGNIMALPFWLSIICIDEFLHKKKQEIIKLT